MKPDFILALLFCNSCKAGLAQMRILSLKIKNTGIAQQDQNDSKEQFFRMKKSLKAELALDATFFSS